MEERGGTAERRHLGIAAVLAMLAVLAAGLGGRADAEPGGRIEAIQLKRDGVSTKVFIMLSRPLPFDVRVLDGDPARDTARRLVLDFENTTVAPAALTPIPVEDGRLQRIRPGQFTATTARIVLDLARDTRHAVDAYETPPHVTIALTGPPAAAAPPAAGSPALLAPR